MATSPNITSFSGTNGSQFTVDDETVLAQNANKSWSLTQPDANTLRFSVQSGDYWSTSGWSDLTNDGGANRSEIEFSPRYAAGTQINISETLTVEPGATNTASFLDLNQLHSTTQSPPSPFVLGLDKSDHLVVVLQSPTTSWNVVYRSPDPIVRGQPMDLNFQLNMGPSGNGYVGVWLDGTQIVNYHGAVGATGAEYFWKEGVYRGSASETLTADFSNVHITTGAASVPSAPTQPTTPTTPTTPSVQPAVTQATATPGTGTEHVGDTITLSLAFNEAVTVTGAPTLSLNDGSKATYFGGSGTGTLTFKTTVASTDTSTSALAITGVNLPSGTAIKDASGIAANLSAAVKTFSGLAVSTAPVTPTQPTTPTTPPTPSATKPVLTIADSSLWVAGRGGTVDLGTKVTTTDSNDVVTVNITGLPKYETITDKLDGQTFRGNNITLTAAQVDSGLELHSYYRGGGYPTATLTLTASAKDPTTGAVATASPQSITVVDPRPAAVTGTTSSHHHHTATDHQPAATTTVAAPTTSQTIEPTDHLQTAAANTGFFASRGFAQLQQHFDPGASTLATTAAHPAIPADHPAATGSTMASFASQSFALLSQYLAAHTGQVDPGQIVAALSQATGWGHDSLLARPQH